MPFLLPFMPYIAAGGAALGGAIKNKSTQSGASMPALDPQFGPLQNTVLQSIQSRLRGDANGNVLPPAFETGGIRDINKTYDLAGQSLDNRMASRGLSMSPIAGAGDTALTSARAGNIADFRGNLPLINRSLQDQDMGMASNFLSSVRGTNTTGTATSGGGAGGAFENLAQMLGYLYGKNAFGGGTGAPFPGMTPGLIK